MFKFGGKYGQYGCSDVVKVPRSRCWTIRAPSDWWRKIPRLTYLQGLRKSELFSKKSGVPPLPRFSVGDPKNFVHQNGGCPPPFSRRKLRNFLRPFFLPYIVACANFQKIHFGETKCKCHLSTKLRVAARIFDDARLLCSCRVHLATKKQFAG